MISRPCFLCAEPIEGGDLAAYGRAGLDHVRADHAEDVPYPDMAVRNYFEGEARMTGSAERLDGIGDIAVHPVTVDRIDDWLDLFDHDVAVDLPQHSSCYCLEPHESTPGRPPLPLDHWTDRRERMASRLREGRTTGYLAYVDGRAAGWVNASVRAECSLFRRHDGEDATTACVACFAVAPPYRRHGVARRLLDRVLADAEARGLTAVEAYPHHIDVPDGARFRGDRSLFERAGFTEIERRDVDVVVRRPVASRPAAQQHEGTT